MSQLDPVHRPTSHFLKIYLNIILPSTPGSPKWSLSFWFPHQNPVYTPLLSPIRAISLHLKIVGQCTCIWTCVNLYVHTPTFIHRSHALRRNCQVRVRSTFAGHSLNVGSQHGVCFMSQFRHFELKRLSLRFHKI